MAQHKKKHPSRKAPKVSHSKETANKNKIWVIVGFSIVLLLVAGLVLYRYVPEGVFGKAVGEPLQAGVTYLKYFAHGTDVFKIQYTGTASNYGTLSVEHVLASGKFETTEISDNHPYYCLLTQDNPSIKTSPWKLSCSTDSCVGQVTQSVSCLTIMRDDPNPDPEVTWKFKPPYSNQLPTPETLSPSTDVPAIIKNAWVSPTAYTCPDTLSTGRVQIAGEITQVDLAEKYYPGYVPSPGESQEFTETGKFICSGKGSGGYCGSETQNKVEPLIDLFFERFSQAFCWATATETTTSTTVSPTQLTTTTTTTFSHNYLECDAFNDGRMFPEILYSPYTDLGYKVEPGILFDTLSDDLKTKSDILKTLKDEFKSKYDPSITKNLLCAPHEEVFKPTKGLLAGKEFNLNQEVWFVCDPNTLPSTDNGYINAPGGYKKGLNAVVNIESDKYVCTNGGWQKIPLTETSCTDKIDDDYDGTIDCADSDCKNDPTCAIKENTGILCSNKADDDGDGKTDCNDADCTAAPTCQFQTVSCSPGAFATGITGKAGWWLDAVQLQCTDGQISPVAGTSKGGNAFSLKCSTGQFLTGIKYVTATYQNEVHDVKLQAICGLNVPTASAGTGGSADLSQSKEVKCPEDQVVTALKGSAGTFINTLKVVCASKEEVCKGKQDGFVVTNADDTKSLCIGGIERVCNEGEVNTALYVPGKFSALCFLGPEVLEPQWVECNTDGIKEGSGDINVFIGPSPYPINKKVLCANDIQSEMWVKCTSGIVGKELSGFKCDGVTWQPQVEICDDQKDNNGDGKVDCVDPDCAAACKVALLGDVTGDGVINTGDAIQVVRYSLGLVGFTDEQKVLANVVCGKDSAGAPIINTGDAIQIIRLALGLRGPFEACLG